MGLFAGNYAEYANEVKESWVVLLRLALESQDWDEVENIIKEIDEFYFSE